MPTTESFRQSALLKDYVINIMNKEKALENSEIMYHTVKCEPRTVQIPFLHQKLQIPNT